MPRDDPCPETIHAQRRDMGVRLDLELVSPESLFGVLKRGNSGLKIQFPRGSSVKRPTW